MIRLHHLNKSRSLRIIWLLEELGIDYEIVNYQRDPITQLAPNTLKTIHALGKSPLIEMDGKIIAESGAIVEFLIEQYAPNKLRPALNSPEYAEYLQWIHFSESSLMLPILMELFVNKEGIQETKFLLQYIESEKTNILQYLDKNLENKSYLVNNQLSGADFMLSFVVIILYKNNALGNYPNIKRYTEDLLIIPSLQKALMLEKEYGSLRNQ